MFMSKITVTIVNDVACPVARRKLAALASMELTSFRHVPCPVILGIYNSHVIRPAGGNSTMYWHCEAPFQMADTLRHVCLAVSIRGRGRQGF